MGEVRVAAAAVERADRLLRSPTEEHPDHLRLVPADPVRAGVHQVLDQQPQSAGDREVLRVWTEHGASSLKPVPPRPRCFLARSRRSAATIATDSVRLKRYPVRPPTHDAGTASVGRPNSSACRRVRQGADAHLLEIDLGVPGDVAVVLEPDVPRSRPRAPLRLIILGPLGDGRRGRIEAIDLGRRSAR